MTYTPRKIEDYAAQIESIRVETCKALTPAQGSFYSRTFFSKLTDLYLNRSGRISEENKVKMESASRLGLIFAKYAQEHPEWTDFESVLYRTTESLVGGADPRFLYNSLENNFVALVEDRDGESLETLLASAPCGLKCSERRTGNKNRPGGVWTDEQRVSNRRDYGGSD